MFPYPAGQAAPPPASPPPSSPPPAEPLMQTSVRPRIVLHPTVYWWTPQRVRLLTPPQYGWPWYLQNQLRLTCAQWNTLAVATKRAYVLRWMFPAYAAAGLPYPTLDPAQLAAVANQVAEIDAACVGAMAPPPATYGQPWWWQGRGTFPQAGPFAPQGQFIPAGPGHFGAWPWGSYPGTGWF